MSFCFLARQRTKCLFLDQCGSVCVCGCVGGDDDGRCG